MTIRHWTEADDVYLRTNYGKVPTTKIAAHLRRTIGGIQHRAHRLSLKRNLIWLPKDDAALLAMAGTNSASIIAKAIGSNVRAVRKRCKQLGVATVYGKINVCLRNQISALHAEGRSDTEIAISLGKHVPCVRTIRVKLGLSSNWSDADKRKAMEHAKSLIPENWVALRNQTNEAKFKEFANKSGWPSHFKPIEVRVLNAIALSGPLTGIEIGNAIGTNRQSTILARMISKGMLVKFQKRKTDHAVYLLSMEVMDVRANANPADSDGSRSTPYLPQTKDVEPAFVEPNRQHHGQHASPCRKRPAVRGVHCGDPRHFSKE